MKRISIVSMLLLFLTIISNAQDYVSKDPQNRNVLIEEYTGVNCQYCPAGHMAATNISNDYPDRVWTVNIHAGHYATWDFETEDGNTIFGGFGSGNSGFPSAIINRSTTTRVSRDQWRLHVEEQVKQTAECNVGGQVRIDPATRTAFVTVEVYYTANSSSETNYLSVYMLQDSILSYQSNGTSNPSQVIDGQYCHNHILRDAITPAWGDAISPTTKESLVTKTYEYKIPEKIGAYDVNLNNISFLAFVTEKYEGTPTLPILNVNKLNTFQGSNNKIYPIILSVGTSAKFSCSNEKVLSVSLNNCGLDDITKLEFDVTVGKGEAERHVWEGNIPSYESGIVELKLDVAKGKHNIKVKLVKANDVDFTDEASFSMTNEGYEVYEIDSDKEEFTIEVMQDKYGNQITWELLASDYSVLASGGDYDYLSGTSATFLNEHKVEIPAGECVKFIIRDSQANGICCKYGDGYYRILDSKGNEVVDGDGEFGAEASHVISIVKAGEGTDTTSVAENDIMNVSIYPNPARTQLNVEAKSMKQITIINALGQVVYDMEANNDLEVLDISQYNEGIYVVRILTENETVIKKLTINN